MARWASLLPSSPAASLPATALTAFLVPTTRAAQWANLLASALPSIYLAASPSSSPPVSAPLPSLQRSPPSGIAPRRSRPSSTADLCGALQRQSSGTAVLAADVSLPVGAAAYIMRAKAQRAEDSNPLSAQDFGLLGSTAPEDNATAVTGW